MKDHEDFYKQVGAKIRDRRGKNLSQESLAWAVGLTRTSISNIEAGRQKLLLHTLVDIADALRVTAPSLLPARPDAGEPVGGDRLAQLPDNERSFIEAAIGIKQEKRKHGRQEKKDTGDGGRASAESGHRRGSDPGMGHRTGKGGADRA